MSGSYGGAMLAGYVVTFSAYHFAHGRGHLQLVALEWVPLCLLCLHRLLTRPSVAVAVAAAGTLLLVDLCDNYYLFYCVLAGLLLVLARWREEESVRFLVRRPYVLPLAVFLICSIATTGVLAMSVILANRADPFLGAHRSPRLEQ